MRIKSFIPIRDDEAFSVLNTLRDPKGFPLWMAFLISLQDVFDVFVDTDSPRILEIIAAESTLQNVVVFLRDHEVFGPSVSTNTLIQRFLDRYRIQHELLVQTHINFPFLRVESILKALPLLQIDGPHDSVLACNRRHSRFWSKDSFGYFPINHNPMDLRRTSDLLPVYEESSAFYVVNAATFRNVKNRVGLKPCFFEIPTSQSVAIHNQRDWMEWQQFIDTGQRFSNEIERTHHDQHL